jgi:hypothetical protein
MTKNCARFSRRLKTTRAINGVIDLKREGEFTMILHSDLTITEADKLLKRGELGVVDIPNAAPFSGGAGVPITEKTLKPALQTSCPICGPRALVVIGQDWMGRVSSIACDRDKSREHSQAILNELRARRLRNHRAEVDPSRGPETVTLTDVNIPKITREPGAQNYLWPHQVNVTRHYQRYGQISEETIAFVRRGEVTNRKFADALLSLINEQERSVTNVRATSEESSKRKR